MEDALKKLQEQSDRIRKAKNSAGIKDFEGLSPNDMRFVLYDFLNRECPVQLNPITAADIEHIPILKVAKYIIEAIQNTKNGEMKLTAKGNLLQSLVGEIIDNMGLREIYDRVNYKKINESDVLIIHLCKIVLEISKVVKKRNNKLSLTKNGEKIIKDVNSFFLELFESYCYRLNWAYYGYDDSENCARIGVGFSIYLLYKYGGVQQDEIFYAEKYLKAFPAILREFETMPHLSIEQQFLSCYRGRTFNRFMKFFGLAEIEKQKFPDPDLIKKTEFFDRLVHIV